MKIIEGTPYFETIEQPLPVAVLDALRQYLETNKKEIIVPDNKNNEVKCTFRKIGILLEIDVEDVIHVKKGVDYFSGYNYRILTPTLEDVNIAISIMCLK